LLQKIKIGLNSLIKEKRILIESNERFNLEYQSSRRMISKYTWILLRLISIWKKQIHCSDSIIDISKSLLMKKVMLAEWRSQLAEDNNNYNYKQLDMPNNRYEIKLNKSSSNSISIYWKENSTYSNAPEPSLLTSSQTRSLKIRMISNFDEFENEYVIENIDTNGFIYFFNMYSIIHMYLSFMQNYNFLILL